MHRACPAERAIPDPPRRGAAARIKPIASVLALLALACSGQRLPRPDVLLVTLGPFPVERLACHGGPADVGTGICSIADEGSRFVWAFAAAAASAPAAATLLSGLMVEDHGLNGSAASFLRSDVETLAEHAAAAGYATAAFVEDPGLNRSSHLDQGFGRFDDGTNAIDATSPAGGRADLVARATQWLATAPSPFLAWVHLDPVQARPRSRTPEPPISSEEALRRIDRDVERLLAVLDARPDAPAVLVTALPDEAAATEGLSPATTRVVLLWRPPRVGGGRNVGRVIRTPVSQIDVTPTLLRAMGLIDPTAALPGRPLPFRERRAGEDGRTLEIEGVGERGLVGEGVFLVIGDDGAARGVARLPLAGERSPALGDAARSDELVSRLWAAPEGP